MASFELRDGEMIQVPDLVVDQSCDLVEDITRTLVVRSGVTLTTHGTLSGTISIQDGGELNALAEPGRPIVATVVSTTEPGVLITI